MPFTTNSKPTGRRPATLNQIAVRAGVSLSAVSRIIAGKKLHTFSEATIQRVRAIAEECHYRPNLLVQGMQTGLSGMLGVLIPAESEFYGSMLAGIHDVLIQHNRVPIVLWSVHDSTRKVGPTELEQIHALVDRRVEGIILKPVFDSASNEYLHEIIDRKIPLVVVDRELPKANCCYVGSDDEVGMKSVLDHLAELGHREIAYFGPSTVVSTGMHRLHRFQTWMREHPEVRSREHLVESWMPAVEDALPLLECRPQPTAIATANDHFARALYRAAARKGIQIPDELSVAGSGNLPLGEVLTPSLTTVDQHPYDIGQSATRRILALIGNNAEQARKILIHPDLIVRESTAPPRKSVKSHVPNL